MDSQALYDAKISCCIRSKYDPGIVWLCQNQDKFSSTKNEQEATLFRGTYQFLEQLASGTFGYGCIISVHADIVSFYTKEHLFESQKGIK
jgi:hypothetical protein